MEDNNVSKYIIDSVNQKGCFIVSEKHGVYRCTPWQTLEDLFLATVQGLKEAGLSVFLNSEDIENNPNIAITSTPVASLQRRTEIPSGLIDGINDTFTLSFNYRSNTLMVYEDGLLLNSFDDEEIIKIPPNKFRILPAPLSGSTVIVSASEL